MAAFFFRAAPLQTFISSSTRNDCYICKKQRKAYSPCIQRTSFRAANLFVVCQKENESPERDASETTELKDSSAPQSISIDEANRIFEKEAYSGHEAEPVPEKEPYPGYYRDMEQMGLKPKPKNDGLKVGGVKSLYRADGTPYAPWLIGKVAEDPRPLAPKKKPSASGRLAADPQLQEIAGIGLKARILGDEVELVWSTDNEENNVGFIVQRRKGGTEEFQVIGDYKSDPRLKSKGSSGGNYSFIDSSVSPGTWVYRISDVNTKGETSDLSQTLVEIASSEDKTRQKLAVIILSALIITLFVVGLLLDPLSRT
ncbi:hypothetical protein GAYE_SCF08G3021 [Galdieria yellowstonensis]|uniref:Uncharacterized protein n=1 Tax=Galdieria yellowstonensis TaxID=3028027 RepID=A0AAV9ID48_9RHOD|nr:hypothetical protein GAYE_SCF08G3021 [Galdieria yellowstonensis]